jgi:hypothetical protein
MVKASESKARGRPVYSTSIRRNTRGPGLEETGMYRDRVDEAREAEKPSHMESKTTQHNALHKQLSSGLVKEYSE